MLLDTIALHKGKDFDTDFGKPLLVTREELKENPSKTDLIIYSHKRKIKSHFQFTTVPRAWLIEDLNRQRQLMN